MITFANDYSILAAREIIEKIEKIGQQDFDGYGEDEICRSAREKIMDKLGDHSVDIHFLSGGTQTNALMISAMLRPYEAVLSPDSGHINVHECGSIEAMGHRIETVPHVEGKLDLAAAEKLVAEHNNENVTVIKAVYISDSTEFGSIYTLDEIKALRAFCDRHGFYLYMDGARFGAALTSAENDITWKDLTKYLDCFYIGATKNGGMLGEALVIVNDELKPYIRNLMKQQGALLAKGFLLGIQYDALFSDDLYERLARHENEMAMILKKALVEKGYRFLVESPTNQQFVIMPNEKIAELQKNFKFHVWEPGEKESCIRLVTSFGTTREEVETLISCL